MWCGIDLGSRNVKIALMNDEGKISFFIFDTIKFYRKHGKLTQGKLQVNLDKLLKVSHINNVVATGYGRQTIDLANALNIPEIKAHVTGAIYATGLEDFTLLDLGGQDSKVALVRGGRMVDFQTNDKCAASTGRYLENMAGVLDMTLFELSKHHADPVNLTSTCAIFGESELIGRIVEGYAPTSLAAGVNHSIFKRIRPMLQQILSPVIVFTGGVAASVALKEIIGNELEVKVVVPPMHQYTGAIGCSVIAQANFLKKEE